MGLWRRAYSVVVMALGLVRLVDLGGIAGVTYLAGALDFYIAWKRWRFVLFGALQKPSQQAQTVGPMMISLEP